MTSQYLLRSTSQDGRRASLCGTLQCNIILAMSLTAWLVTFATWTSFLEGAAADYSSYNNSHEYMDGAYGPYPRQRFLSSDAIAPVPNIVVSPHDDVSSSSYVLWTPAGVPDVGARPMILDARDLSLVWYAPMMGPETLGATVQRCNDTDFITVWTRTGEPDWKAGAYYLVRSAPHRSSESF